MQLFIFLYVIGILVHNSDKRNKLKFKISTVI